jgi:hypothetical protein
MAGETSLLARDVQQKKLCGEPGVEAHHRVGRCTLLRPEHLRCALWSHQRTVHIAGDLNGHPGEPRVEARQVNRCHPREVRARTHQLGAGDVAYACAQGNGDAKAPIGGGAAAHTHDEAGCTGVEGGPDEITGAKRAGGFGVALGVDQSLVSRCLGQLHHGGAVGQQTDEGVDGPTQRITCGRRNDPATRRSHQGVHGALATVGHRHLNGLVPGQAHTRGDCRRRVSRAERALEGGRGHDHAQGHARGGTGGQSRPRNSRRWPWNSSSSFDPLM